MITDRTTATEFWPRSFFEVLERRRNASEVVESLEPLERRPLEEPELPESRLHYQAGVEKWVYPDAFRCANCDRPVQGSLGRFKVPVGIKEKDPAWYVKEVANRMDTNYVDWCFSCALRLLPAR